MALSNHLTSPNLNCPVAIALEWFSKGQKVVVATVIETWGSAPRPLGSQLFIRGDGIFEGSVSGGCIEGAVIEEASELLKSGGVKTLEYGVSNERAWEVGLSCGGTIKILLSPITQQNFDTYEKYLIGQKTRETGYLVHSLVDTSVLYFAEVPTNITAAECFIIPSLPPFQLHIIGAVHMAKHLAEMASSTGFQVNVIDPRGAFTNSFTRNITDINIINEWPDDALSTDKDHFCCPFDSRTALVTLTHDPKLDDPAIKLALDHPEVYIGCLGSKKNPQ